MLKNVTVEQFSKPHDYHVDFFKVLVTTEKPKTSGLPREKPKTSGLPRGIFP